MAEMTIRLQIDPATGKKDIIVSLRSDDDALPHEHEQQHRALVDRLIEGGIVKAGEVRNVIVEREEDTPQAGSAEHGRTQDERRSQSEGV